MGRVWREEGDPSFHDDRTGLLFVERTNVCVCVCVCVCVMVQGSQWGDTVTFFSSK